MTMDEILHLKKQSLNCILETATEHLLLQQHQKASILFEKAKKIYYEDLNVEEYGLSPIDLCVIDYALVRSYIVFKKNHQKGVQLLNTLEEQRQTFPPLAYEHARLLFHQKLYHEAKNIINKMLLFLSNLKDQDAFKTTWPSSNVEIPESNLTILNHMFTRLNNKCEIELGRENRTDGNISDDVSYQSDSSCEHEEWNENAAALKSENLEVNSMHSETSYNQDKNSSKYSSRVTLKLDAPEFIPMRFRTNNESQNCLNQNKNADNITDNSCKNIICKIETEQEKDVGNLKVLVNKLIEKISSQEKNFSKHAEKDDMVNKNIESILAELNENNDLRNKITNLELELENRKEYSLDLERHYAEEDRLKSIDYAKLQVQVEELQKLVTKYDNTMAKQDQKIKYLETSLTEQVSRFCMSQNQEAVRLVNKCVSMISDLKLVTPYLTATSAPTLDECRSNISRWEEQLKIVKQHSGAVDEYFRMVFNQICNDEYPLQLNQPILYTDIHELRDILHDNYIPTVTYFIKMQASTIPSAPPALPNTTVWYGNCIQQPGPVVSKPYFHNQIEGIPFSPRDYSKRSVNEISPRTLTTNNSIITEISSKIIECVDNKEVLEPNNFKKSDLTQNKITEISYLSELQQASTSENTTSEAPKIEIKENTEEDSSREVLTNIEDTTPSCSVEKESDLINLNDLLKNKGSLHVSDAAKAIGGPKFYNLFLYIKKKIPNTPEEILLNSLKSVRQKKVKLSGMTREDILQAVLNELKSPSDTQSMNKPAWAVIKTDYVNWSKDVSDNICVICYDQYDTASVIELKCQHSFHSICVRKWFATNSICPICRLHTTTDEDFPPLN